MFGNIKYHWSYIWLYLLFFLVPLELILDHLYNIDTVFKPYRVIQLIIIIACITKYGTRFYFSGDRRYINLLLLFVFSGILSTLIRYLFADINLYLFFNWLTLFSINVLTFTFVSKAPFTKRSLKITALLYVSALALNITAFQSEGSSQLRFSGYFDNSNALGVAGALGFLLILNLLRKKLVTLPVFLLLSSLCIYIVNASGSRAILLVVVLIFAISFFANFQKVVSYGLTVVLIAYLFGFEMPQNFKINALERQSLKNQYEKEEIRLVLFNAGVDAFVDTNFMGLGISQFQSIDNFFKYVSPISKEIAYERKRKNSGLVTHSTYVQLFTEFGILGAVVFAYFLYRVFIRLNHLCGSNFPMMLRSTRFLIVLSLVTYASSHVVFFNHLFWIFLGLALNPYFETSTEWKKK